MPEENALFHFEALLDALRSEKPNDRSDKDRYFAIVITDVEKAKAVFVTYAQPFPMVGHGPNE